jgi:hypothetical protein
VTFSLGLFSYYPIAAAVLVLLLLIGLAISSYFVSQRLKHKRIRLAAVLITHTVAALALIGLAFDIQITHRQASVTYLVTDGATRQQISQIDIQQPVFAMRGAMDKSISDENILDIVTTIDIPSQVLSYQPSIRSIHILGNGLSLAQWQNMQLLIGETFKDILFTFSAFKPRLGLINMQWSRELTVGQFIQIEGQLQGTDEPDSADSIYQLRLLDPVGQIVETIRLKASESFTLSAPAKSIGQWVYQLQLSKPGDMKLIADEPIAFLVTKPAPLRILIKQSAPSFETRQLKNWAAEFGSQISVLTQISQNKDIRQNINMNTETSEPFTQPFTQQALLNFDWLMIDGRALLALTAQQTTALKTAIKNGLGMYIITDNELINAWPVLSLDWLLDINLQPLDIANYSAIPYWPHSKIEQVIPLVKASITSANGTYLVQNKDTQILVSRSEVGLGQVAVSLINTTYSWQTSGLTEQYSHYWQSIIYELARPKPLPYWQNTQPNSLTLVNQPLQKCLLGAAGSGMATYEQYPYPLILTQELIQTEQQCLTVWPANTGWHKLVWTENVVITDTQNGLVPPINTWFYTYAKQDWRDWRQQQNQLMNQQLAQQQSTKQFEKQTVKSFNKVWIWVLLMLSMSMLWLERKLF